MERETNIKLSKQYFQFLTEAKQRHDSDSSITWNMLAEEFRELFGGDITGDILRKRCESCAEKENYEDYVAKMRKKEKEFVDDTDPKSMKEEYVVTKDGKIEASKVVAYAQSIFGDRNKLMQFLGYSPLEWQFENLRVSLYEGAKKGDGANRQMAAVRFKLKPLNMAQVNLETYAMASDELFNKYIKANPRVNVPKPIIEDGAHKLVLVPPIEAHLGKLSHSIETGVNYDYKICSARVRKVFNEIVNIQAKEQADRCLIVIGGDFFNSEGNGTTTAGTPQESTDTRYVKMFNIGEQLYTEGIEMLRTHFKYVEVMLCAGNHSRCAEFALYKSLKSWFRTCNDVQFSEDYKFTQSHMFGNTCMFFNHGDPDPKRLHRSIAAEFPVEWGKSKFRYLFVGHLHKLEVIDNEAGLLVHRVPAICENDAWHYTNRFGIGIVPMHEVMVFDDECGMTATYFINFVKDKK
jgi:hypothetical protein